MNEHKKERKNKDLEPGVNTVLHPDPYNPGPTDMIEEAVGEIVDNITHPIKGKKKTDDPNKTKN
ncbi:hypothetical protein JNUCC31_28215 [Paenibacillus sp. JNUCC31]|uniref:hypothetical protein n=1 Tax=Paenibacillus sp. JNUCC-31 TaxID=2777983 RepID=UPI0017844923|nr:hypothetical protein [Paenibacillus sp. JNUCC-31]QOS78548.1 hypothetical protein JNUCC31_28215 [Paenibacillus sp. JNUCC-31]